MTILILHLMHSYLERNESASFINNWYQYCTYYYLEIGGMVVAIVIFLLYLMKIKWSYFASLIYFTIMIVNGLYHITSIILEGKSFNSNEGSILTSSGFIVIGILLVHLLRKNKSKLYNSSI